MILYSAQASLAAKAFVNSYLSEYTTALTFYGIILPILVLLSTAQGFLAKMRPDGYAEIRIHLR